MASEATSAAATATPSLADRITRDPAAPTDASQTDGAGEDQNGSALHEPEYEVEVKLADLQQDPNNPLFSLQKFEDLQLPEAALKGILAMNFRKPSKIQEKALPLLFLNPPKNFIGQSQSGTGKTAAFVLNLLNRVDVSLKQPQGLVLAPSRELARQIQGVVATMAKYMPELKVDAAIPDPTRKGPLSGQIVVGTPGTVQDLIRKRWLNTQSLKVLVLDEADNMLDQQGLGDQCKRVRMLLTNKDLQVTLFSATFPDKVMAFARLFAPEANVIQLRHNELTVEGIKQFFFDCDSEETKYNTLVQFYGLLTISSSIIFCKRRDTAQEIERRMTADGHQVAHLSAALEGAARDQVIDRFRSGAAKVLITTNVLSRGIDVSSVTMVVNYDIPEGPGRRADPETYLHRIGRTGRFGKVGVAVSFISDKHGWDMLNEISTHFGCQIEPLPTDDWDRVEDTVKRVIKSARAGKSTKEMQQGLPGDAMVDGAAT